MIAVDEAIDRVLALRGPVEVDTVPLIDATGRWLAEPLVAHRTQPARVLSSMDGYAVRRQDLPGPWRVIGESAAGTRFDRLVGQCEAVRISTGAALPSAADCVIVQESVSLEGQTLSLTVPAEPVGNWIRDVGSDFTRGDLLLAAGAELTPPRIALAAVAGRATLAVRRRVRVAFLSTGTELVPVGVDSGDDRLPESNSPMLAAMLRALPCEVHHFGIVSDDLSALTKAFHQAAPFDILVTTGGASVGDHDLVRPALIAAGGTIDFWKIAMRPGKPLMAGMLGRTVVLCLPGNPVSAFVTATLFLLPLVRHMSGASDPLPRRIVTGSANDLPAVGPRTDFVRARWQDGRLASLPSTDSGALLALAQADALIVRPAGAAEVLAGAQVEAILLA